MWCLLIAVSVTPLSPWPYTPADSEPGQQATTPVYTSAPVALYNPWCCLKQGAGIAYHTGRGCSKIWYRYVWLEVLRGLAGFIVSSVAKKPNALLVQIYDTVLKMKALWIIPFIRDSSFSKMYFIWIPNEPHWATGLVIDITYNTILSKGIRDLDFPCQWSHSHYY